MRLLVAEDHPSLARSLADGLREEGYAVDLTFDGEEAEHLVTVNTYDAVSSTSCSPDATAGRC